ncbi:MAG: hypothetical protein ABIJ45_03470 [Candidatus Zixiibacteriota bacterium]
MQRDLLKKLLTGLTALLVCIAIVGGPQLANAQDVAVGTATATILAVLAVTSTHDLAFGDVLQGVPQVADKTVIADAGVFEVTGAGGSEVSLFLELPDFLWNSTGGSEDRLTITFSSTDADIDTTAAGTPAAHGAGAIVDQDPYNLSDTNLGAADNILKIFLGGTVYPTVDQRAGSYTADIVLTVAYTGT